MHVCVTVCVAVTVCPPSHSPPGDPTAPHPFQSRCAGLSRGNFRVGGGFVCTGRCLGGGDGREGYFSPLFLFIGSLTTARTAAAPPPLSCLPRLPPLSPSAARRNSMPIRFGARRQPDQRRGRGTGRRGVGDRLSSPEVAAPTVGPAPAPRVRRRRPRPTCVCGVSENRVGMTRCWVAGPEPPGPIAGPSGAPGRLLGCGLTVAPWRAWPLGGALEEFGNN